MTYEEYLKEFSNIIDKTIFDYKGLHMEKEDMYQEAYLLLFQKLDKLEDIPEVSSKAKYFKTCLIGHFKGIIIKEHEQLLRNTYSYNTKQDGYDEERIDNLIASDVDLILVDPFLERIYKVRKECTERWKKENKEHIKQYQREWRKKNKEFCNEYARNYYQEHRDVIRKQQNKQHSTEEHKAYRRKYYEEHKEEINKRRKELYALKKSKTQ